MAAAGDLNIALVLKLVDQLTAPMKPAMDAVKRMGALSERTGRQGVEWSNRQIEANRNSRQALHGQAFGALAAGAAFAGALRPAVQFEKSMAQVGAVSRANDEELALLTSTARELGATTPWAASQAAEGMQYLAMAGFDVNQTVDAMPGMLNLASAGALDLGRTSDIASDILTGFGMQASDMGYLGDVLTNTFTSSNTDLSMLGETMKYVAPVAANLGVSVEQTAAMAGKLGDAGIKGSQGGTALRAILSRLAGPTSEGAAALENLGIKVADANGNLRDVPTIMKEMQHSISDMGSAAQQDLLKVVFGEEAAASAAILLGQAGSGALQDYAESLTEVGSAARVAAKMNDNTDGALKRLGSIAESVAISLGSVLLPEIVNIIDGLIPMISAFQTWAEANPELVKWLARGVAGMIALTLVSIALKYAFLGMVSPFLHIIRAGSWMLVLLPKMVGGLLALMNPFALVRGALVALRVAFIATGIGALIAGLAMAGVWVYNNWSGLKSFFVGFGQAFMEALGPARPLAEGVINAVKKLWSWVNQLLGPINASAEQWSAWGAAVGGVIGGAVASVVEFAGKISGWLTGADPIVWADLVPEFSWSGVLQVLNWASWLLPIRWLEFIPGFEWSAILNSMAWGDYVSNLSWSGFIDLFTWENVLTALDWMSWLHPVRWLDFIPGFEWSTTLKSVAWADYLPNLSWSGIIDVFTWDTALTALDWASWLLPIMWLDFIPGFEWSTVIGDLDISSWLNFTWGDVLPNWDWSAIIPDLPDIKGMFTDAGETVDVRLENRATTAFGEWEEGLQLVEQYRQGIVSLQDVQDQLTAKVATEEGAWNWSYDVERAAEMLALLQEVETTRTAAPVEIADPATLAQAAQTATDLEARFPTITAAANDTLAVVRDILAQIAEALQSTDHSIDGANIVQTIANGMLGQMGAIQSAASQIRATIRNSLSQSVGVSVNLAAAATPAGGVPRRDAGGPVRPGFLYEVNERGQEFFSPGVAGSIVPARVAQAAAAASMAAMPAGGMASEAQITNIIDQRPALTAQAPAAPVARAGDTNTFHIHPTPGMDPEAIAREVERILNQRDADRRGDLYDGGAF